MTERKNQSGALRRRDFVLRGSALLLSPLAVGAKAHREPAKAASWPVLSIAHLDGERPVPASALPSADASLARSGADIRLLGLSTAGMEALEALSVDVVFGDGRLHHAWRYTAAAGASNGTRLFVPVQAFGALTLDVTARRRGAKADVQRVVRLGLETRPFLTRGTYLVAFGEPGEPVSWDRAFKLSVAARDAR